MAVGLLIAGDLCHHFGQGGGMRPVRLRGQRRQLQETARDVAAIVSEPAIHAEIHIREQKTGS